jgi:hypothetical protein
MTPARPASLLLAAPLGFCLILPASAGAALSLSIPEGLARASDLLRPAPVAHARRVAAEDLFTAFDKDRANAELRFKNRPLAVPGVVARVGRNEAGVAYVQLEADGASGGVLLPHMPGTRRWSRVARPPR